MITVEAQTACDLFGSCKRTPFVSSVSALGSPAGFLTFQGHNAVDDAYQYIEVKFSNNKNDSLYFSDDETDKSRKALTPCNYTTAAKEYHGFPVILKIFSSQVIVLVTPVKQVVTMMRVSNTQIRHYSKDLILFWLVQHGV